MIIPVMFILIFQTQALHGVPDLALNKFKDAMSALERPPTGDAQKPSATALNPAPGTVSPQENASAQLPSTSTTTPIERTRPQHHHPDPGRTAP